MVNIRHYSIWQVAKMGIFPCVILNNSVFRLIQISPKIALVYLSILVDYNFMETLAVNRG